MAGWLGRTYFTYLADQLLGIGSLTADHGVNISDLDFNILEKYKYLNEVLAPAQSSPVPASPALLSLHYSSKTRGSGPERSHSSDISVNVATHRREGR